MFSITYGEQVVSKLSVAAWKTLSLRDLNIKLKEREGEGEEGRGGEGRWGDGRDVCVG